VRRYVHEQCRNPQGRKVYELFPPNGYKMDSRVRREPQTARKAGRETDSQQWDSDVIEMDEIYTRVKKGQQTASMDCL
jgi:hypothetical protein